MRSSFLLTRYTLVRSGRFAPESQAADHQQQALALYREIGHPSDETRALNNLGEIRRITAQFREALIQHTAAFALATQIGDHYEQADMLLRLLAKIEPASTANDA